MTQKPKKRCLGCRKPLPTTRTLKYCSASCRYDSYLLLAKHQRVGVVRLAQCSVCQNQIKASNRRKFCSPLCYEKDRQEKIRTYAQRLRDLAPVIKNYCHGCAALKEIAANLKWCPSCLLLVTRDKVKLCNCTECGGTDPTPKELANAQATNPG